MRVAIHYVDTDTAKISPELWPHVRSDGVSWVEVDNVKFQGESIYWLYKEDGKWIAGSASFYKNVKTSELVIHKNGRQERRPIKWVPDLRHSDVKLGWWWQDAT